MATGLYIVNSGVVIFLIKWACPFSLRAMEFVQVFLMEVADGEKSLDIAAGMVVMETLLIISYLLYA